MFHIDDVPSGAGEGIKDVTKALAVSLSPDAILTLLSCLATSPVYPCNHVSTAHTYHEPIVLFCSRLMIQCVAFVPPTKYWFWWVSFSFLVLAVRAAPLFLLAQSISHCFCNLLPLRRKLPCCPSEWVSITTESEPTTNTADFDPIFPDLRDFPGDRLFFKVFYRNVAKCHLQAQRG